MQLHFGEYRIRDWHEDDAPGIAKYANNYKISKNLRDGFPHPYRLADAEEFLEKVRLQALRTFFALATDTEVIGGIGLGKGEDVHRRTAEMGFWLAEPYETNPASARVLEKAGFRLEGIMRANVVKEDRVLDQRLYARIKM